MSTPYITPNQLSNSAGGSSFNALVPGAEPEEILNSIMEVCWRATHEIDGIVGMVLRASQDKEQWTGPDFKLTYSLGGYYRAEASNRPILGIVGGRVSSAATFPRTWTTIPVNQMDVEGSLLGLYGSAVSDASGAGSPAIHISPGYLSPVRNSNLLEVIYLNGWPHCSLTGTTKVPAGSTSFAVDDVTGWTGVVGQIYDGAETEVCKVLSVVDSNSLTGLNANGPGTVTLAAPTLYDHQPEVDNIILFSSMPSTVQEAAILLAQAQTLTVGTTTLSMQQLNPQVMSSGRSTDWLKGEARKLLSPFRKY